MNSSWWSKKWRVLTQEWSMEPWERDARSNGYLVFRAAAVETKLLLVIPLAFHNGVLDLTELHAFTGRDFWNWSDGLSDFTTFHLVVKAD